MCVKVDLSIETPTNPDGDVDVKDVYSAFSEVAECVSPPFEVLTAGS